MEAQSGDFGGGSIAIPRGYSLARHERGTIWEDSSTAMGA